MLACVGRIWKIDSETNLYIPRFLFISQFHPYHFISCFLWIIFENKPCYRHSSIFTNPQKTHTFFQCNHTIKVSYFAHISLYMSLNLSLSLTHVTDPSYSHYFSLCNAYTKLCLAQFHFHTVHTCLIDFFLRQRLNAAWSLQSLIITLDFTLHKRLNISTNNLPGKFCITHHNLWI